MFSDTLHTALAAGPRFPIAVAFGFVLAVGATSLLRRYLRDRPPPSLRDRVLRAAGVASEDELDFEIEWLPPSHDAVDRRQSPRRCGRLTAVRVAAAGGDDPRDAVGGLVVDRSAGGLRIAADRPFVVGDVVLVRADAAPPGTRWVEVTVRHCRHLGDHYQFGCEFVQAPPPSVFLLFG